MIPGMLCNSDSRVFWFFIAARIAKHEDVGLGFLDRAHPLFCGKSLVGVCGGQECDARHFARVKIHVLVLDGVYVFGVCAGGSFVYGGLPLAGESG